MDSKLTSLLDIVGDGKWHELARLQEILRLDENEMRSITFFLSNFDFVLVDDKSGRLRIRKGFRELPART